MSPLAWIRVIGEALGLVERAVDVGEKIAGKNSQTIDTQAARAGQAAGAAANASQAATSQRMRGKS